MFHSRSGVCQPNTDSTPQASSIGGGVGIRSKCVLVLVMQGPRILANLIQPQKAPGGQLDPFAVEAAIVAVTQLDMKGVDAMLDNVRLFKAQNPLSQTLVSYMSHQRTFKTTVAPGAGGPQCKLLDQLGGAKWSEVQVSTLLAGWYHAKALLERSRAEGSAGAVTSMLLPSEEELQMCLTQLNEEMSPSLPQEKVWRYASNFYETGVLTKVGDTMLWSVTCRVAKTELCVAFSDCLDDGTIVPHSMAELMSMFSI